MAFCMKCGAPLLEGAVFCIKCGAKQDEEEFQTAEPAEPASQEQPAVEGETEILMEDTPAGQGGTEILMEEQPLQAPTFQPRPGEIKQKALRTEQPQKKKGGFVKKLILPLVAIMAIAAAAVAVMKMTAKPLQGGASFALVDIKDCVDVVAEGNDGLGVMTFTVDTNEITDILRGEGFDLTKGQAKEIAESVVVTAAKTENLSNGEEVLFTASGDINKMSEHGIRFAQSTWGYTISGLTPTTKIDPFEYVEVYFTGISPCIDIDYEAKDVPNGIGRLSYEWDREGEFAKGDEVILRCTEDPARYIEDGFSFTEMEKTYVIDNVASYVKYPGDITEEGLNRLKKEAEDSINAMLNEHEFDDNPVKNTGLTYIGLLVLNKKNMDGWGGNSEVVLIYSTSIYSDILSPTTVYYPYRFYDVVVREDGFIDIGERDEPAYGEDSDLYPKGTAYESPFPGFSDTDKMFSVLVRRRTDEFTYELDDAINKMF